MLGRFVLDIPSSSGIATYPPGATFGPRVMRDYEFVWMIEGDAEYRWGQAALAAPAGSVVLCRPGETDFFRWDPQRPTRHAFFHFHIRKKPRGFPEESNWPLVRPTADADILRPMFRHLMTWIGRGEPMQVELGIAFMLAVFVTGEITAGEVPISALPEAVEKTRAFIHQRLEADASAALTLDDLADAACITPEHLCRLFKSATGRSPAETVRLARLDRAAVLLARSNYSVAQIAEMTGFASQFHFSRRFKEAFGQSPMSLRQAVRAGQTPPTPRLLHLARLAP